MATLTTGASRARVSPARSFESARAGGFRGDSCGRGRMGCSASTISNWKRPRAPGLLEALGAFTSVTGKFHNHR